LILLERAPWPVQQGVPLPTETHPAFEWLALQTGGPEKAVLDLVPAGDRLTLAISGETLYATDLHNKPTASGVSSMWPESTWFLLYWLPVLTLRVRPLHGRIRSVYWRSNRPDPRLLSVGITHLEMRPVEK
jgi:hypothetical protein